MSSHHLFSHSRQLQKERDDLLKEEMGDDEMGDDEMVNDG